MTFVSYAQNFEDVLLWRALQGVSHGCYVDIGAQDPVRDSVSKAFYDRGWRGIHAEANGNYAQLIRAARPDEDVIEALVSDDLDVTVFYEVVGTGLSTAVASIAEEHRRNGYDVREVELNTISLATIFDRCGDQPLHWMKIDVEGMEANVLRSWGEHSARPWILLIESTYPNSQKPVHEEWLDLVVGRGYTEVYYDGLSRYFIHSDHHELASKFSEPPNIFDGFEITETHFSAGLINQKHQHLVWDLQSAANIIKQEMHANLEAKNVALKEAAIHQEYLSKQVDKLQHDMGVAEARLVHANTQISLQRRDILDQMSIQRERFDSALDRFAGRVDDLSRQLIDSEREREVVSARLMSTQDALRASDAERANLRQCLEEVEAQLRDLAERQEEATSALAQISSSRWWRSGRRLGFAPKVSIRSAIVLPPPPSNLKHTDPSGSIAMLYQLRQAHSDGWHPTTLAELLNMHDEPFVRMSYRLLLGREGDPDGVAHYLLMLREGVSKMRLLGALRQSEEGRRFIPGLAGLDRAIRRYQRGNYPVVGWLLRKIWRSDGENVIERRIRQIQNQIGKLEQEQASTFQDIIRIVGKPVQSNSDDRSDVNSSIFSNNLSDEAYLRGPLAQFFERAVWGRK